jgi:hypothetical protein
VVNHRGSWSEIGSNQQIGLEKTLMEKSIGVEEVK